MIRLVGGGCGLPAATVTVARIEHDPEKACPGLDPGWVPVFGKDHAPAKNLERQSSKRKRSPNRGGRHPRRSTRMFRGVRVCASSLPPLPALQKLISKKIRARNSCCRAIGMLVMPDAACNRSHQAVVRRSVEGGVHGKSSSSVGNDEAI